MQEAAKGFRRLKAHTQLARHGHGDAALVESKGTRSDTSTGFNSTVDDGYTGQVEPHLGYTVGTSTASHGYCIGSYLKSPTKAS